jgi:hypothetical protein
MVSEQRKINNLKLNDYSQAPRMPTTWEVLLDIWPLEDRPERYLNVDFINSLTVETALALMAVWEKQQKKENKGEDTFGKDPPLPTRHIDGGPDNCADLLHPGRWVGF